LALNIINKSFTDLVGRLDYAHMAPLSFLWALKFVNTVAGNSEFCFRLIPLMAGICSLTLYYFLACQIIKNRYGIIASTWLFAVAYNEILYSSQVKQYSLDVLAATVLIYTYCRIITKPLRPQAILLLTFVSVIAIFISYPAVFIIGGISIGLLVNFRKIHLRFTIFFTGMVSLFFIIFYFLVMKKQSNPYMLAAHIDAFAPHTFDLWYLKAVLEPFDAMLGRIRYLQYLLLFICIIGLFNYVRRGSKSWGITLISPVILALIVSWLHKYPFTGRFLLYTTPCLLLLFGHGVGCLCDTLRGKYIFGLLITFIIVPYTIVSVASFSKPCGGVREAIQYVVDNKKTDDIILIDLFAAPTVEFYQYLGLGFDPTLDNVIYEWLDESTANNAPSAKTLISSIPENQRIWFVAEASGGPRRFKIGFLRKRVNEIEELLHTKRNYIDKYYTDRAFAVCYSSYKK